MKKFEKISFRGIDYADVSPEEALELCMSVISGENENGKENEKGRGAAIVCTPNAEIAYEAANDLSMRKTVSECDIVVADGAGVVLAAKLAGKPIRKGKVAGIELCEGIVARCAQSGHPIFIYGGKPTLPDGTEKPVAQAACEALEKKYPGLKVAGWSDGYRKDTENLISEINSSGAEFLAVCLGSPKQEQWMTAHRIELTTVRLMGGFGGSADIYAGISKRAPKIFIKLRMEWLYRLIKEPKRLGRMMRLPKFVFGSIFAKNNS